MKRIMKYFAAAVMVIAGALEAGAQKPADGLSEISETYEKAEHLSMDVDVYVFADRKDAKGKLLGTGMIRKSGGSYYSKLLGDEMIMNKHCTVIIDHEQKTIDYFEPIKKADKYKKFPAPVMSSNDSVVYRGTRNGLKEFSIYSKNAEIVQTDLYVNEKSNFIEKIIYYYNESLEDESFDAHKVVIHYKNISRKPVGDEIFSEKKYLSRKGGKPSLMPAFKNYQLTVPDKQKL